jgi:hypothetical protein
MGKRGPKEKTIDWNTFEGLCGIAATESEICSVFNMDNVTLAKLIKKKYKKKFSEVFREKREIGNVSLRRSQWRMAVEKDNVTMQIFLGKNRLGQTDKVETVYTNKDDLKYEVPESMRLPEDYKNE